MRGDVAFVERSVVAHATTINEKRLLFGEALDDHQGVNE